MKGDPTQASSEKVRKQRAAVIVARLKFSQVTHDAGDDEEKPVCATELADLMGIKGPPDGRKKRIREAVEYARLHGEMICANNDGYWLARDVAEYTRYEESRTANTKFEFIRRKRRQQAVSEKNTGQTTLFSAETKGSDAWARV